MILIFFSVTKNEIRNYIFLLKLNFLIVMMMMGVMTHHSTIVIFCQSFVKLYVSLLKLNFMMVLMMVMEVSTSFNHYPLFLIYYEELDEMLQF